MLNPLAIGTPGFPELIIILVVLLLLFGGTRLPQLARGLGKSISEFKKGVGEGSAGDDEEERTRRAQIASGDPNPGARKEELRSDSFSVNKPR